MDEALCLSDSWHPDVKPGAPAATLDHEGPCGWNPGVAEPEEGMTPVSGDVLELRVCQPRTACFWTVFIKEKIVSIV